ncbi:MAG: Hsp70 family protein [Clostridia bacterium]|nr:Hsp70 family protein [Deltaproteobacteria bacterium]
MSNAAFAVGIDLGTTNTALAATALNGPDVARPDAVALPQTVAAGEVATMPMLPSFLYVPADGQFPPGALRLPWGEPSDVVGIFARSQSATPARLVSSAKSWLSHAGIDRRAPILPWQAPEDISKVSPVQASARYLAHVRAAWDAAHPEAPLAAQDIVLTVPASFDAVARDLTVQAAAEAGLPHLRLLEEPQAALYAWLADEGASFRHAVRVGDIILVCDIGGGTTDFSLIAVRDSGGSLELERIAVGDHILLGGDNMDLALAYTVKARLESQGTQLDEWQMRALTFACRGAKEAMLADGGPETYPLVVPGRSSRLIGGTIRAETTRAELTQVLLDGFFPQVDAQARPQAPRRAGLTTLGLPYASDAAVTRHLAAFLGRASLPRPEGHTLVHPTAVLFNGGVTRSPLVRDRIHSLLSAWAQRENANAPAILGSGDPDLAVCRGAAHYACVRHGGGVRIKGGTAQAYYVGVERAELAVPGVPPRVDALCVAPFGMEEGSEAELPNVFGLYVGEPVAFRFFASSERRDDKVGTVVDPNTLTELSPIETTFDGTTSDGQPIEVRLHARVTEVGMLEMDAVPRADATHSGSRRWKLSFNVRVH